MKRIVIYILILGALFFVPVQGTDIGKLRPVEVVFVYREGASVVIQTDTNDVGIGNNALQALQNLKDTTPGYIYLDTAEYLLMTDESQQDVEDLRSKLRKNLQLCFAEKEIDLEQAARFLPAHGKLPQLKGWKKGEKLSLLVSNQNRLMLT